MSTLKALVRPFIALLCGWLVAYLHVLDVFARHYNVLIPIVAILLPLAVGVIATLTADKQNKHFIALAILTGALAVTGWYSYWYLGVERADDALAASCHSATPDPACYHGPISASSYFNTNLLILAWIVTVVLVLVSSLITVWVTKYFQKLPPLSA